MLITAMKIGVIYASTNPDTPSQASQLLKTAIQDFLAAIPEDHEADILWSVFYTQEHTLPMSTKENTASSSNDQATCTPHRRIIELSDLPPGLALEDDLLRNVRAAWEKITGGNGEGFMQFTEREGMGTEGEEEDEV